MESISGIRRVFCNDFPVFDFGMGVYKNYEDKIIKDKRIILRGKQIYENSVNECAETA